MFKLKIDNFRSFENQTFDLSRINILIGENSGGKSSLLKFLLALKQTLENPSISNLVLSDEQVDLGSFKETIRNHDESKSIDFSFSFKDELSSFFQYFFLKDLEPDDPIRERIMNYVETPLKYETIASYSINKTLDIHECIQMSFDNEYLGSLSIIFNSKESIDQDQYDIITESPKCTLIYKNKKRSREYLLENIEYEKKGFLSIISGGSLKKECKEKHKSEKIFFELAVFLLNQNLIEYYIHSLKYLNPLSSKPERIYIKKDTQNQYKKTDIEKFTSMVTNDLISGKNLAKFSNILKEFGIANGFKIISPKNLPVSELRVKIKELVSNVKDVGYGVALQIPILFEAFMAEKGFGNTFLIEQPEVHLHPKLQAKFIETLLSLGEQNSYIIETHSEHIVRMLQILVKKRAFKISNEEIRIYYFSRGDEKFDISRHDLDVTGKMSNEFPSGFFDNSYNLTKALIF